METNGNLEQKIVETAKRLFSERGYERTSMSEIAAGAGISRPTLHYYFRTKEKMFEAVFGDLITSLAPRIEQIAAEERPFSYKIGRIVDEYMAVFSANPSLPRFIFSEIQRDADNLVEVMKRLGFRDYLVNMQKIIDQGNREGVVKNLPVLDVLLTFIGMITIPFVTKNMIVKLVLGADGQYDEFLLGWKRNVVEQMENLLLK